MSPIAYKILIRNGIFDNKTPIFSTTIVNFFLTRRIVNVVCAEVSFELQTEAPMTTPYYRRYQSQRLRMEVARDRIRSILFG